MPQIGCVNLEKEVRKCELHPVRLDSDVWEAVKAMSVSLNVYLRGALLDGASRPRKVSKRQSHIEALKASDPLAEIMERDDVEFGNMELPSSGSVAMLDAVGPTVASGHGKASQPVIPAPRKAQTYSRGVRQKGDKTR